MNSRKDSPAQKTVDEVVDSYSVEVRGLADRVRALVRETLPEARETVKWGNPVFEYRQKGICYIQGQKGYLRFGFQQGVELDDPEGLLEGTGKTMRHVKLRSDEDIRPVFRDWLKQAAAKVAEW